MRQAVLLILCIAFYSITSFAQTIERISFDSANNKSDYYLAIRPASKNITAVVVLLTSFLPPERLLAETKLHNTTYANDMLTVVAPMKGKLYADSFAVNKLTAILLDTMSRFGADTSKFVLAGYDEAGNIALRYTELSYEHPKEFPLQPKAVVGIDTPVDLFGMWLRAEGQIKKNYWQAAVGDAKYYLETMTKENGTIYNHTNRYKYLSPFDKNNDSTGNERFLKNVAVRLYYDMDVNWQLLNRRNSLYDTKIPDASELIKRLLLMGNESAELMSAKEPGMRSNGERSPNALSIVDEPECVQWIKKTLGIFDVITWQPLYYLLTPEGWDTERFSLPPDFAPELVYNGVEDIRFAPGWGDVNSDEHWSYCFLWWLDGTVMPTADGLQKALTDYYDGLVGRNIVSRKIPENKIVQTKVDIQKIKTVVTDAATFGGTMHMLDYHAQKPITLNCVIHVKGNSSANHTAVFFEVSPRPSSDVIWKKMNAVGGSYKVKE